MAEMRRGRGCRELARASKQCQKWGERKDNRELTLAAITWQKWGEGRGCHELPEYGGNTGMNGLLGAAESC